jgi:hypothetical protein
MPLRDVTFQDLQVWITHSVDGSSRFDGRRLSPSQVIGTQQVVGAVLRFAIRAKYLTADLAEEIELLSRRHAKQRYLNHEQLNRPAVAADRFRTSVLTLGYCGLWCGPTTTWCSRPAPAAGVTNGEVRWAFDPKYEQSGPS